MKPISQIVLALALLSPLAQAQIPLCLEVNASQDGQDDFAKLVQDEIGHHPTHKLVEAGCRTRLTVDLYSAQGSLYLTARVNREIPVRFIIRDKGELEPRLKRAISLALHNEPVYLAEDITHYSALQRAMHSVLKKGNNTYRMELMQNMTFVTGSADVAFASGGAFGVTRGSGHWQVMARVFAAGWPERVISERKVLRVMAGAEGGVIYEFSELGSSTFYVSAGAGVQFVRFEGLDPQDSKRTLPLNAFLISLNARMGVRFFRFYDFDFDLYAAASLPLHPTSDVDVDTHMFGEGGAWTPSIQLGLGVGF